MRTPWGEEIRADRAWPEYPRPQLVRENWLNLNGFWEYAVRPRNEAMPARFDGQILVPFCIESELSGVGRRVASGERLWYRRTFRREPVTADAPLLTLLHFGAVDYAAAVWLNDGYIGAHAGGFDPFTFEITGFLKDGENVLVVAVDDATSADDQPRGKQHAKPQGIWYTPVTGIWQTVWLEQVDSRNHIVEVRLKPKLDVASVDVEVLLARPTRAPELAALLTVRLGDEVIVALTVRPDRLVSLPVPDPKPWSPEMPTLYTLDVQLVSIDNPLPTPGGSREIPGLWRDLPLRGSREAALYAATRVSPQAGIDAVRTYFAMRTTAVGPHPETGKPTLLLNGAPVFHLATLDQGWWPDGLHTPPADAAIIHEIGFLKAAGFNAVRKHIKVEPARFYYHCDRLGLLVWQDMPSGFLPAQFVAPNDESEGIRSSAATERFELELGRMIRTLSHHPSIVVWVLHNEGWGQFDSMRLTAYVKGLDPSRPVNAASGWLDLGAGDFIDRHDYQPEPTAPAGDGRRAVVIGEYGGIGWPIAGHLWDPGMRNWGYQTLHSQADVQAAYQRMTRAIAGAMRHADVCAAVYTQTTDVEGEVNGLLTYDRRVEKLPRDWLRSVNASLRGSSR